MKLSDYIRIGLTAGIAVNVWLEAGKWTALAITIILIGGECHGYLLTSTLRSLDTLVSIVETLTTTKNSSEE